MPKIDVYIGKQTPDAVQELMESFHAKNDAITGMDYAYSPFYLTAADEDGSLIGYLSGHTGFHEIYVGDVIINGDKRSSGAGRALLQALEQHFTGSGFSHIFLTTYEYQAPGFYKKCGYTLEYMRPYAKDPRLNKYHFVKYLK